MSPFRWSAPVGIIDLQWRTLDLELASPLVTSADRFEHRRVLVLRVKTEIAGEQHVGYGEISPLRGWSEESVEDCEAMLASLADRLATVEPMTLLEVHRLVDLPALCFGLELACLDAVARHLGCPLRALWAPDSTPCPDAVDVQYTLGAASIKETLKKARSAVEQGFSCLKIKVGATSASVDIERISEVRRACPDVVIRLDANGAFEVDEARFFLDNLAGLGVDLVEQPVAFDDLDGLAKLSTHSAIDIAADESCIPRRQRRRLLDERIVDGLVLKPMALGGLLATRELIEEAAGRDMRVVLSTLIESAIARRSIAQLAAACPEVRGAQGLATGSWFATDLAPEKDRIVEGQLVLSDRPGLGFVPHHRSKTLWASRGRI